MVINELAQWSVLLILVVFVFGLTRQLGSFLSPPEAQRSIDWGPGLGEKLPDVLLDAAEREQVSSMVANTPSHAAALIVVHERCGPCDGWLDSLAQSNGLDLPLVLMAGDPTPEYRARLSRLSDLVIADDPAEGRLRAADLTATPFLIVIDKGLRIRHKQIGGDFRAGLRDWSQSGNGTPPRPEANGAGELRVKAVIPERGKS